MEYEISDLLDGLENAGQPIKPRGGSTTRVKALTLARLRKVTTQTRAPSVRRFRPLTAAAAVLAAVLLLSGGVFAAWKLGAFRFTEYFGMEGEVLDEYAQTYEPDPAQAVKVISAESLQTKEELEAYFQPVFATCAETEDYRFSLRSLTAGGTVLYAVVDVEGLSDFGRANLDTPPEFALHNTTHHASGTVLDSRLVGAGENVRRWLFGIVTANPINEVGDVVEFETLSLYEAGGWSDRGYRLFDVRLEKLVPAAVTLSGPAGESEDGVVWKKAVLDAVSLTLEGEGLLSDYKAGQPTVILVFQDGARETVLDGTWRPYAPRSDHDAAVSGFTGWHDGTAHLELIFGMPLDPAALAAVIVDGQTFSLE